MEYGNPYGKFKPENFFDIDSNNLRKGYIKNDLRNYFSSRFELEERKIELEEEIEIHNEAIIFLINELQPKEIEIIHTPHETFIVIPPKNSPFDADEIEFFGFRRNNTYYNVKLVNSELTEINDHKFCPNAIKPIVINDYKIYKIVYEE